MRKIYKPHRDLIVSLWTIFGILFLAFILLGVTSDTATPESMLKGMSRAALICLVIPIMTTFFTYTVLVDDRLKVVKWLVRREIRISQIKSIQCTKAFLGFFTDIDVFYLSDKGEQTKYSIGTVESYGKEALAELFAKLHKVNPRVEFDECAQSLIKEA